MAQLHKSVATLRIFGDSLIPEEISRNLGRQPTASQCKGEVIRGPKTGREHTAKTGMWRLEATDSKPENLDAQVTELLSQLTQNLEVWAALSEKFELDLFCGLFMNESNEGVCISLKTLEALARRGIELSLDIYGPDQKKKQQHPNKFSEPTP